MAEAFLLIIRWLHTIAAVAWVGGAIFYLVVVRPTLRSGEPSPFTARFAGAEFGQLVNLSMWTLVLTGGVLALDALSLESGTVAYFSVLTTKMALAGWMFFIVQTRRGQRAQSQGRATLLRRLAHTLGHINMTVALGIAVFVISDILRFLVQRSLET